MLNSKISLCIDDNHIETTSGKTILEAALDSGIYIPHICHHPNLSPHGACKLCVVEIEGLEDICTSCSTIARDGMVIKTKTQKLNSLRCLSLELMFSDHPSDCATCPKYMQCELQSIAQYLGIRNSRLRNVGKSYPPNLENPLFLRDMERCIQCGRCIRACQELRGVKVMDYIRGEDGTYVGISGKSLMKDAGCRFCGACVEVCPTGALRDKDGMLNQDLPRSKALVPCRNECPAGVDIPRFIRLIAEGKRSDAVAVIREKVPFPMTLGDICSHPCESVCRRKELNDSVSICKLKRYAAEYDDQSWKNYRIIKPAMGKTVAVIGSGPAGLTAAYYLTKAGHKVTVFEALEAAGGMMRVGIPEYRLPKTDLENEIQEILSIGVEIKYNRKIEYPETLLQEGFHAVLAATGAHKGQKLPIEGSDLKGVFTAVDFLRAVNLGTEVKIGKKVLVIGGGNVAFDCARTARRLAAEDVHIAFLEPRDNMMASADEAYEAVQEGISIHPSTSFAKINSKAGAVTGVECITVESFAFDENKKLQVKLLEGSNHEIEADTVVFATGQIPERFDERSEIVVTARNSIIADEEKCTTSVERIFAAGDAVTGTASVIKAIAGGRNAASSIDMFLGGDGIIDEQLTDSTQPAGYIGRIDGFADLTRNYEEMAPADERTKNFNPVSRVFDMEAALKEAERCLKCDLRLRIDSVKFWNDYDGEKDKKALE